MKWLINLKLKLKLNQFLYIFSYVFIAKLLLFNNALVSTYKSPPIVRHSGTCTYQQSQVACTFSLVCYLVGGLPVEGCEGSSTTTCCVLQHTPSIKQMLDYSKLIKINENAELNNQKSNTLLNQDNEARTMIPSSSITYSDTDQQPPIPSNDDDTNRNTSPTFKNTLENSNQESLTKESHSNLMTINNSNQDDSTLHSSSSSLSTSTNPYDSLGGYQMHQIHSPRSYSSSSLPISNPTSLQYHHRLQHTYSAATNANQLNHQKQHQQNLYMHNQRLAHHPSLNNHHNSLYHSSVYHQYNSPYQQPRASSNARSFQFNRYNDPLFSQYQSNYLLNDNLNYYSGETPLSSPYNSPYNTAELPPPPPPAIAYNSFNNDQMSNYGVNDQTINSNAYSSLADLPSPTNHPVASPSPNAYNTNNNLPQLNEQPDNSPPSSSSYLNDYSNPSSVSSSSSLLSSYSPTIDYKTYQKHSVNPNSYSITTDHLKFPSPSIYSTSSFESTTNHTTNHHLLNSNKIYDPKPPPIPLDSPAPTIEPPTSIKYFNTNLPKNTDYETSSNPTYHLSNTQPPDDNPTSINTEEDPRLLLDNSRLTDEDEYNSNAIRRSRLASASPLNSITLERQTHARNFIGENVCGKPVLKPTARIIGGQDASPYEFPWMSHIKVGAHQCGGALVSRWYVATAAHCVFQAPLDKLTLIIGAHDIELKNSKYYEEIPQHHLIESVLLHPNFRFSAAHPDRFDIALLKLKRPALYTNAVRPICLPPSSLKSLEGWRGVVTGWGKTNSNLANRYGTRLLQKVDVPIIKNQECEKWHQTRGIDIKIFSEMMCAGYEQGEKDACVGDSGGPLIIYLNNRWTLAGITSAGFGCAQSKQPGIYHRVSHTVDWILEQLSIT